MMKIILMVLFYLMMQSKAQNETESNSTEVGDAAAVNNPIIGFLSYVLSINCEHLKTVLGLQYGQMKNSSREPDLKELSLVFLSSEINVTLKLSTAANYITEQQGYNPNNTLRIFIHGFTDDPSSETFTTIRNAYVAIGLQVLALDCSSLIGYLYLSSTTYVRYIGEKLGEVIAVVINSGMDPSTIHIIGHSLGAHIAGFTGKEVFEQTGRKVGRISGLDPAGPCFVQVDGALKLNKTDAEFVDVIHTDAGVFGLQDPVGQVDFFPNGGGQQPNCFFDTCDHSRVWELYSESVTNPESLIGIQCDDYDQFKSGECSGNTSYMGYACPPGTEGWFYLQTAKQAPYGIGEEGITYV